MAATSKTADKGIWLVISDEDDTNIAIVHNPDEDLLVDGYKNILFQGSSREECFNWLMIYWAKAENTSGENLRIPLRDAFRTGMVKPNEYVQSFIGTLMFFGKLMLINNQNISADFYEVNFGTNDGQRMFYYNIPANQIEYSPKYGHLYITA